MNGTEKNTLIIDVIEIMYCTKWRRYQLQLSNCEQDAIARDNFETVESDLKSEFLPISKKIRQSLHPTSYKWLLRTGRMC